jgi:Na+-transporting methylmalonyl-CoA/oxaloacetate decarboxylase gamma subunit
VTGSAVVWLVVGLLTVTVVLALLIALIRHLIVLGRAVGRFQTEVGPIVQEITEQAYRAAPASRNPSGAPLEGR